MCRPLGSTSLAGHFACSQRSTLACFLPTQTPFLAYSSRPWGLTAPPSTRLMSLLQAGLLVYRDRVPRRIPNTPLTSIWVLNLRVVAMMSLTLAALRSVESRRGASRFARTGGRCWGISASASGIRRTKLSASSAVCARHPGLSQGPDGGAVGFALPPRVYRRLLSSNNWPCPRAFRLCVCPLFSQTSGWSSRAPCLTIPRRAGPGCHPL